MGNEWALYQVSTLHWMTNVIMTRDWVTWGKYPKSLGLYKLIKSKKISNKVEWFYSKVLNQSFYFLFKKRRRDMPWYYKITKNTKVVLDKGTNQSIYLSWQLELSMGVIT